MRFSNDKSPYRTNGGLWAGEVGGVYLEVDAAGLSAGGGPSEPTRDQLQRARSAIDEDERAGAALQAAVADLEAQGFETAGPALATAPRGYPKDHPRIGLLRLEHYAAVRRLPVDAEPETITATWAAVQPLIDWAGRYVGAALSRPEIRRPSAAPTRASRSRPPRRR